MACRVPTSVAKRTVSTILYCKYANSCYAKDVSNFQWLLSTEKDAGERLEEVSR